MTKHHPCYRIAHSVFCLQKAVMLINKLNQNSKTWMLVICWYINKSKQLLLVVEHCRVMALGVPSYTHVINVRFDKYEQTRTSDPITERARQHAAVNKRIDNIACVPMQHLGWNNAWKDPSKTSACSQGSCLSAHPRRRQQMDGAPRYRAGLGMLVGRLITGPWGWTAMHGKLSLCQGSQGWAFM